MDFSYSQFKDFAECPRRWQLGRRWTPKRKAAALNDGSCWHSILASFYTKKSLDAGVESMKEHFNSVAACDERDVVALGDAHSRIESLSRAYWQGIARRDLEEFDIIAVEAPFVVRLARGVRLRGIVDAIVQSRSSGIRFIMEHKYQSDLHDELMPLDLQVSLYVAALREKHGLLPVLYNVCRKPLFRKGKEEGQEDFRQRVVNEIEKDLAGLQYAHDRIESKFFVRRAYTRCDRDVRVALEQTESMAARMRSISRNPRQVWRNVGDHCIWRCPFRDICIEEDPIVIEERFDPRVDGFPRTSVGGPAVNI